LFLICAVVGSNHLQTRKISANKWMEVKALPKTLQSSRYGAAKTHVNVL